MLNLYIANLGKYNEGFLVGDWISLPFSDDELNDLFVKIKLGRYDEDGEFIHGYEENDSIYEEWAIHDYECDIPGVEIDEYSNIYELNKVAEMLDSLTDNELEEVEAILETHGGTIEEAIENKDDYHFIRLEPTLSEEGENRELAYQFIDQIYGDISHLDKQTLENYFDYEKFGRELKYDYSVSSKDIAVSNY